MSGPGDDAAIPPAEVRAALARLLDSASFANAQRLQHFLSYVVEQTLAGRPDSLKGYTIGIDVFGRPADFDPTVDAIVRVEAGRLRSKLREYYDTMGAGESLRIELPKGSYVPRFALDGRGAAAPRAEHGHTLLVRPFKNLSDEAGQDYFTDGLSEDLIGALSRVRHLTLIARHSSFQYKDADVTLEQIRRETHADHILEGSVRRAADRVRVSAQLIATADGALLWSDRYDRELTDVFALQDEVVTAIVGALKIRFAGPVANATPIDLAVYDLVARGRECFWSFRPDDVRESQRLFRAALDHAPDYALAHAWYARALTLPYAFHWNSDRAVLDVALGHAREAARLAPSLPFAHGMIAWTQTWRGVLDEALAAGQRAITLGEDDSDAHTWYATALIAAGRGAQALAHVRIARRHEPHGAAIAILAEGLALWLEGDLHAALACYARGIDRAPGFLAFYVQKAATCGELGDQAGAIDAIEALARRHPNGLVDFVAWSVFVDPEAHARLERFRAVAYAWYRAAKAAR